MPRDKRTRSPHTPRKSNARPRGAKANEAIDRSLAGGTVEEALLEEGFYVRTRQQKPGRGR